MVWENLEEWVRGRTQGYLQDLLVEEVTVFLGREKSERRAEIDGPRGYRNGYGKVRKLALSCGKVALARPRVRGVEKRFESRLLPSLFAGRRRWRIFFPACISSEIHRPAPDDSLARGRGRLFGIRTVIDRQRGGWNGGLDPSVEKKSGGSANSRSFQSDVDAANLD